MEAFARQKDDQSEALLTQGSLAYQAKQASHEFTPITVADTPAYLFFKRTIDIVFSLAAIVVLLIPMAIVALIIFIDDPKGSPIFVQKRVGKDGKEFRFYKFRSMVVDAEKRLSELQSRNEMKGPVFKIKDDPRITKAGRFIRKYSIDELPQLLNVLRGDMSIVGPRPPLPIEVAKYGDYEWQRLLVKPGLTCLWQTMGRNKIASFEDWLEFDLKYISTRSLRSDFRIVFMTIPTILTGGGC